MPKEKLQHIDFVCSTVKYGSVDGPVEWSSRCALFATTVVLGIPHWMDWWRNYGDRFDHVNQTGSHRRRTTRSTFHWITLVVAIKRTHPASYSDTPAN